MSNINSSSLDLETESIKKLAGILKKSDGSLKISFNKNPSFLVSLRSNKIRLDVEDPSIFENINIGTGDGGPASAISLIV